MEQNLSHFNLNESPYSKDEETNGFELSSGARWHYPVNYPKREYQFKIVETALFNNTLVCLPTGLGKTFIAAVVMYNYWRWYPKGKVVFMAPTRPLVAQQIHACHDIMGIPSDQTVELTGSIQQKTRVDYWVKKRIIFATAQTFHNDLEHNIVPFKDVKCVVIDEAHKALGKHSYCESIRILSEHNKYFRVLGLSATPGNSLDKVREVVQNLHISCLELRDESSNDVLDYVNERKIEIQLCILNEKQLTFRNRYIDIMDPHVRILINHKILSGSTANISRGRIFYLQKSCQENRQQNNSNPIVQKTLVILLTMTHAYELLQKHGLRAFYHFYQKNSDKYWMARETQLHELLKDIKDYIGEFPEINTLPNGVVPEVPKNIVFGHSKFETLKNILEKHFQKASEESRDTRSIVFVEFKDSVREVYVLLLQCRPLIRPQMFVGQSDQKQRHQLQALQDFKANKVNVLISTSVGEEGLDVGEVDLIVCFDACQKNTSRLVQRMGRTGRKRTGRICILSTDGKEYKDLKATLEKKDVFNSKVLESSNIVSSMYQDNPRMVPRQFNPTCFECSFETQPKTPIEAKKRKVAERKKPVSRQNKQKEKSAMSTDTMDADLSTMNQFPMQKFLMKSSAVSRTSNIQSIDGRPIKSSDVKLLVDDEMGLEFLTLWTMMSSQTASTEREADILKYIPKRPLIEDDFLSSYRAPSTDSLKNMASWKKEEVSMLWDVVQSDDEEQYEDLTYVYEDDDYSHSVIVQTPNSKYNGDNTNFIIPHTPKTNHSHNESVHQFADDDRFPADDIFDQIPDDILELNTKSDSAVIVKTEPESSRFPADDIFDQIPDNILELDTNSDTAVRVKTEPVNFPDEGFNPPTNQVSIFDDILVSSEDEETNELDLNTTSAEGKLFEDLLETSSDCELFQDVLGTSSEEEEEKEVADKSAKNQETCEELKRESVGENNSTNSDEVSQALLEIRKMSLGQLGSALPPPKPPVSGPPKNTFVFHTTSAQQNNPSQSADSIPSKFTPKSQSTSRQNNNPNQSSSFSSKFTPKSQSNPAVPQSQNRPRIELIPDSDDDMFIDDEPSDDEVNESFHISSVPDTQVTQRTPRIPLATSNSPAKEPAKPGLSLTQKAAQLSLSLRGNKSKPEVASQKPVAKPSLSTKKRRIEFEDDGFDNALFEATFDDTAPKSQPAKKAKLSLGSIQTKRNPDSGLSSSQNKTAKTSNFNVSFCQIIETTPTPKVSQYFNPNTSFSKKDPVFQVPKASPVKVQKRLTSFFQPKSAKSNAPFAVPSTSGCSDKENRFTGDPDFEDDVFIRPKTPSFRNKSLMPKSEDSVPTKVNQKVNRDDSFYGMPCRDDYLAKKRYERRKKKVNSPKKARGFIDDEAEVSMDVDTSDGSTGSENENEDDNFVSHSQYLDESHMHEVYLKSTKSPRNGNFIIREKKYLPKSMVYSQQFTQGIDEYVNDSFCVDDIEDEEGYDEEEEEDVESEGANEMSYLESLERILEEKKKQRKKETNGTSQKKSRRRVAVVSDSSEDEMELLRKEIAEESKRLNL